MSNLRKRLDLILIDVDRWGLELIGTELRYCCSGNCTERRLDWLEDRLLDRKLYRL